MPTLSDEITATGTYFPGEPLLPYPTPQPCPCQGRYCPCCGRKLPDPWPRYPKPIVWCKTDTTSTPDVRFTGDTTVINNFYSGDYVIN